MESKTKVVLDADVINHFFRGGLLPMLPKIIPDLQFVVLDIVIKELPDFVLSSLYKVISQEKSITEVKFSEFGEEKREYLRLTATNGPHLGRGESACMVYCRFHNDVVGSSNTKDIIDYCNAYNITYLTTNDFLYYAIQKGLISKDEAVQFIQKVRSMGSFPPVVDFDKYVCNKI